MNKVLLFHLTLLLIATPVFGYLASPSVATAASVNVNNYGSVFNSGSVIVNTGGNSADGAAGGNGADGGTNGTNGANGVDGKSGAVINGTSTAEVRIQQVINGVEQEPLVITKQASGGQSISVKAESRVENNSSTKEVEIKIARPQRLSDSDGGQGENSSTTVIASSSVKISILERVLGSTSSLQAGSLRQTLQNIINKFIRIFF